jgi:hypothetical protein
MGFYSTQQLLKHECFNKVIDYLGAVLSLLAKTVTILALICIYVNTFCTLFCKINRICAFFAQRLSIFNRGDCAYCYFLKKCYKM